MNIGARTIPLASQSGATGTVGPGVYVIAELGVNHDGSVERALQLTDAAADAGADAVKLQCFEADRLMSRASRLAAYQAGAGETDPAGMLRRLELPLGDMAKVVQRAHERGIHAIVTVFSVELVAPANELGWDAYKTASPDIVHRPLLEALCATGRPMIVSTGASEAEEVRRAVGWLQQAGAAERLAVLQCVSSYPAPDDHAAIGGVPALRRVLESVRTPIGYSDHTRGTRSAELAVLCGATVLEKHMTHNRAARGPDHAASLEPAEFAEYVRTARGVACGRVFPLGADPCGPGSALSAHDRLMIGPPEKRVLECEREVRNLSRQSVVAARALARGTVIGRGDVVFKRPGTGVPPYRVNDVIGARAGRDIERDELICPEDLA